MDRLERPTDDTANDQAINTPSTPAVVIFQLGEGSSDNYLIDLPALTVTNSNFTRLHSSTQPTPDTQDVSTSTPALSTNTSEPASTSALASTSASALASSTNTSERASVPSMSTSPSPASQPLNGQQTEAGLPQRNMSVSVSYVYSHTPGDNGHETRREGTIMLNVPNVPFNRTEGQMNNMIELAASIALGAVAAFTQRRHPEISRRSFDSFKLLDKSTLVDDTCPICYDAYLPLPPPVEPEVKGEKNEFGKRSRHDDDMEVKETKSRKLGTQEQIGSSSDLVSSSSDSPFDTSHHNELREQLRTCTRARGIEAQPKDQAESDNLENGGYTHIPVELPCGHIFGRSCSYQWLKTKSTCPLCRTEVHSDVSDQNPPQTINLPDIASFMTATRNRRRPLVIVLDRNTNTLSTRVGQQDPLGSTPDNSLGAAAASTSTAPQSSSSFNDTSSSVTGSMIDDEVAFENILPLTGFHDDSLNHVRIPSTASASVSPARVQRDPSTQDTLNRSFTSQRTTDGLFPIGVASTRTRQGVQTFNLDNESSTMGFATEARRMLLERRLRLNGRDRFLGFNERGEAITLPHSRSALNGVVSSSSDAEARQMDETTQTDDTGEDELRHDE